MSLRASIVKELALVESWGQILECPPALLEALPKMTALETLWWCKTPSEQELQAMKLLPSLCSLELQASMLNLQEPWCLAELSGLTGLTLLVGKFSKTFDLSPVSQLIRLEILQVCNGLASQILLHKTLKNCLLLKDVIWSRVDSRNLHETLLPKGSANVARCLTYLSCSPVENQACGPLQSFAFPLLVSFRATRDMDSLFTREDVNHSLAWFPTMCRSAPILTSLELVPPTADHQDHVPNVRVGISYLTALMSLHLILRTEADSPAQRGFVGTQQLTGLTCLTRLWVEGVVDPRSFDMEVDALSRLKALRELLLFEIDFVLEENYVEAPEDCKISREAVDRLCTGLPKLRRFAVMGGWVGLGSSGWSGSLRVQMPEGLIVLQNDPRVPHEESVEGPGDFELKDAFDGAYTSSQDWTFLMKDVLKA